MGYETCASCLKEMRLPSNRPDFGRGPVVCKDCWNKAGQRLASNSEPGVQSTFLGSATRPATP